MILSILNELASTLKSTKKLQILEREKSNALLKQVFFVTYNKRIKFYTKRTKDIHENKGTMTLADGINIILSELATRKVTGNAALDLLTDVMIQLSYNDCEVMRRIIKRDLECGASISIANKVWKNMIPEQPQCLASSYNDKNVAKIVYPAYSQEKADGARCFATLIDNAVESLLSRNMSDYTGLTDIEKSLIALSKLHSSNVVIDGELVYQESYAKQVKQTNSLADLMGDDGELDESLLEDADAAREKGNGIVNKSIQGTISQEEQSKIIFKVWDIIDADEYYSEAGIGTVEYEYRYELLKKLIGELNGIGITNIVLIDTKLVNSFAEAKQDYTEKRLNEKEGTILKNKNFLWEDRRVPGQVKIKNKQPLDLLIYDVYPHKKDKTKAGGFILVDLNATSGNFSVFGVNAGSGLTDTDTFVSGIDENGDDIREKLPLTLEMRGELDREYIMKNKHLYIGKICEIECDGITKSKNKKYKYSVFLPIVKKIRHDKDTPNDVLEIFGLTE